MQNGVCGLDGIFVLATVLDFCAGLYCPSENRAVVVNVML